MSFFLFRVTLRVRCPCAEISQSSAEFSVVLAQKFLVPVAPSPSQSNFLSHSWHQRTFTDSVGIDFSDRVCNLAEKKRKKKKLKTRIPLRGISF